MPARESILFSQPGERENAVTRLFHAPIEHVFRVFTERDYAPFLLSENPADVTIEEMEVRAGGRYSIVIQSPDGTPVRIFGEYLEVMPPRRVVNTFNISALPGLTCVETDEFEAVGDKTRLSVRWKFDSRADRDKMWGPDFESTVGKTWENADRLLEKLA